jgi:hypothetical protein
MNTIKLIIKWKYHIGLLMLASIILSALFTSRFFVTPLFRSVAVVYPANIKPYSNESETEQMLQLMNSGDIRDSLIQKFDLGGHYQLDKNDKHYYSDLLYLYSQRVSLRKTEFESVNVEVLDTDPIKACDMVKAIIHFYDKKVGSLHKLKFYEVVQNYRVITAKKRHQLDSIQQAIDSLGEMHGLKDLGKQSMDIAMGMQKKMEPDLNRTLKRDVLKKMNNKLNTKDGAMVMLTSLAMSEAEAYSEMKLKSDQALLDYNRDYTYSNIVSNPFPADKKFFPKTWLIISITTLATFFLSLLIISFIENQRRTAGKADPSH